MAVTRPRLTLAWVYSTMTADFWGMVEGHSTLISARRPGKEGVSVITWCRVFPWWLLARNAEALHQPASAAFRKHSPNLQTETEANEKHAASGTLCCHGGIWKTSFVYVIPVWSFQDMSLGIVQTFTYCKKFSILCWALVVLSALGGTWREG